MNAVCTSGTAREKSKTVNAVHQVSRNKSKGPTANAVRFVETNKSKPETICLDDVSDADKTDKSTGTISQKVPRKPTAKMVTIHKGEKESNIQPPIRFCPIVDDNPDEDEQEISMLIDPSKKGYANKQTNSKISILISYTTRRL